MNRAMAKAERLQEMERLYFQRAYSDQELSERLGVDRTTVYRDRIELETSIPFSQDEQGRYRIDRTRYLSHIRLNLNEALALYLSARRASQQTHIAQPHTASALEKLSLALRQPMTDRLVRAADRILGQHAQPERVAALETVARAWVEGRKARLRYQGLHAGQGRSFQLCPYLIEPSPWADGVYVIGWCDELKRVATFKVERILEASLSGETFSLPQDFDEQTLLQHAWGIWAGEGQLFRVRLRFAPGTASRRLRESIWHPSQTITDLAEGGCEWSAQVAEWREMLPWVRGWGSEVEVLEPEELRRALVREARRLAEMYQIAVLEKEKKVYYAHSKDGVDQSEWQRLIDHLTHTAELAAQMGQDAGIADLARTAGFLHDIGKYSEAFQRRLEGARRRVDHSTAGAQEVLKLYGQTPAKRWPATILAYCIAGHHAGLPDYGSESDVAGDSTLLTRSNPVKTILEDYSAYQKEIDLEKLNWQLRPLKRTKHQGFSVSFLTRMVFSTLVDADWLETETYMSDVKKARGGYESIEALCRRFNQFLQQFDHPSGAINQKRTETLKACKEKAAALQGVFTLTVPTGGGKTLASMAFALNHAVEHGLKRVIYVIPFTSIIEQNAGVFKQCLGEENVLEHHSNFDWEQLKAPRGAENNDDETNKAYEKLKLAAENWDIPIVVTTNVQFFESLFANQKSRSRKLHNMAKSVIIFDEAQMLPREYMKPCMLAVQELVLNYSVSAVFCTATQPLLQQFMPDITNSIELAAHPQALFDFYKRVQVRNKHILPDAELLTELNAYQQVLCIVNTRKHAKGLFDGLDEEGRFHLSTLMCPAHRKKTLLTIRERLNQGEVCRVVSTQVMEAGIDVDFPVGYRALAGLDSIIQAAGRVNREGKLPCGEVMVFEPETDLIKRTPTYIKQTAEAARSVLRDFSSQPDSIHAIHAYFALLDTLQDPNRSSDTKDILACLDRSDGFDFKTAAEKFRLIDNKTVAVIIPYNDEAVRWVEDLKYVLYPAATLRKLQNYTVNIYEQEFQALNEKGAIVMVAEVYAVLSNMDYYDAQTGIDLPARDGGEAIFFD